MHAFVIVESGLRKIRTTGYACMHTGIYAWKYQHGNSGNIILPLSLSPQQHKDAYMNA
jgi:hypothetical protein